MTLEEQVVELRRATVGMKSELLEIKEYLADNKNKMDKSAVSYEKSDLYLTKLDAKIEEITAILNTPNPEVDLSGYVTKDYLVDYCTTEKMKSFVFDSTFNSVKKSELFSLIPIQNYATTNWVEDNFTKLSNTSLDGYITIEGCDKKIKDLELAIYKYVPTTIENYKKEHQLATEPYVKSNFVAKDDIGKYISDLVEDADLSGFAKKTDLNNYFLKSEFKGDEYVKNTDYTETILKLDTTIKNLNLSLDKYATKSQLSLYVTKADVTDAIEETDFVTREYLEDKLAHVSSVELPDTSQFITFDECDAKIRGKLQSYTTFADVYAQDYINDHFAQKEVLDNNYYSKVDIDTKFLTKNTASETYLTMVDAYGEFLSKEDYRGIKDAMTLNAGYKNAENIFELLLKSEKILDGFYIVGDNVVIVKDNQKYATNLTGSNSYTKNEIDKMFTEKSAQFREKNWKMDTGGNY